MNLTTAMSRPMMEMLVFPIIKALFYTDGSEKHKLIGTGFFLDDRRFFSAKHVFEGRGSASDLEGATGIAVYCVHAVNLDRKPVARHLDLASVDFHRDTDIASGLVEMNQFGRSDPSITDEELRHTAFFSKAMTDAVPVGTAIYTVAYPLAVVSDVTDGAMHIHAQSDAYEGTITKHYPEGRDKVMLPWPCYETDMQVMGGASGGPVIISGSSGVVFAVNCTGTEPHSVSHVTSLAPLVNARAS